MASEIKLPELGENLEGGEVLDVKVKPGDVVTEGQTLLEVEAEKATVEVPAPTAGRITQLLVKKGDQVKVGQLLCLLEGTDGKKEARPKDAPAREAPQPSSPARNVEQADEPRPAEVRAVERAAAKAEEPRPPAEDGRHREADRQPEVREGAGKLVPAGPATRRLARELGVDLTHIHGSGKLGRVTEDDVKGYIRGLAAGEVTLAAEVQAPPLPDFARWGPVERQALSPVRKRTAQQMRLAWGLIPHVTHHDLADITDLDAFRRQHEGQGPKLTVTAFALKAAAVALKQFPSFNASFDPVAEQLILKRYYHIGVVVDTEHGLLVPVIRDVDKKGVRVLAQELADAAERARQRKLQADEMRGGTFTITNLGGIGGAGFTPIINYPEVAILGMSRARLQPVVRDGQVVPRLLLPLSLSYDHRVIDGAVAARFARRIAEMLEKPLLMLW
jgi:pyruvate dehydrogenase E2 component (dihydrolipoamide acetyltransferase)